MLMKGRCFCSYCLREFGIHDAVYVTRTKNGKQYNAVVKPERFSYRVTVRNSRDEEVKVVDKPFVDVTDGVPENIEVTILPMESLDFETLVFSDLNRACPYCFKKGDVHLLPYYMGMADSYLIGMAGLMQAGKSSYAGCITSVDVQDDIARAVNGDVISKRTGNVKSPKATGTGVLDLTHCFFIRCKKGGAARKHEIAVYFMDVGGETFTRGKELLTDEFQMKFILTLKKYADAILLFHDDRDITNTGREVSQQMGEYDSLINMIVNRVSHHIPLLCCLNKADRIRDAICGGKDWVIMKNNVPVITKDSPLFRKTQPGEYASMIKHMTAAYIFMKAFVKSSVTIRQNMPCFFFSSGKSSGDRLLYDEGFNNLYPILYLLKKWGIYEGA